MTTESDIINARLEEVQKQSNTANLEEAQKRGKRFFIDVSAIIKMHRDAHNMMPGEMMVALAELSGYVTAHTKVLDGGDEAPEDFFIEIFRASNAAHLKKLEELQREEAAKSSS